MTRASAIGIEFDESLLSEENLDRVRALNEIAAGAARPSPRWRWPGRCAMPRVTSTLVGVSSIEQLEDNLKALDNLEFSADELAEIDKYAEEGALEPLGGLRGDQAVLIARRPGAGLAADGRTSSYEPEYVDRTSTLGSALTARGLCADPTTLAELACLDAGMAD